MDGSEGLVGAEAQVGGLGGGKEERAPEASPVRQPRSDLGNGPLVVEEPVEPEMPAIFVGTSTGVGSLRPIGMGDFLERAIVEDLAETLWAKLGLATSFLAAREEEQPVEVEVRAEEEQQVDEEEVLIPRRNVVKEAGLALRGRGLFVAETYVPLLHAVEPSFLEAYRPRMATYNEALVLRDRSQHLSE